ncbi:unnamed protein product [Cylicocyclus nassatus]|uniref:Uncharacterized protein n=1 Tax=Cylicocyclus nassatus TaxID=53992 RepID=A0AA36DQ18_CYLNA|nr:unnamed protein product [Cylicocyclus nassatus]
MHHAHQCGMEEAGDDIVSETIESLCKRAQDLCTHARHNLRHNQPATCDEYAKKHTNVYATTFGTRCHSCKEDKGITLVNVYPQGLSAGTAEPSYGRPAFCEDKKCYGDGKVSPRAADDIPEERLTLPYWHIAEAASRALEEKNMYDKRRAADAWDKYFSTSPHVKIDDVMKEGEFVTCCSCGQKKAVEKSPPEKQNQYPFISDAVCFHQKKQGIKPQGNFVKEKKHERLCGAHKTRGDGCDYAVLYECEGSVNSCPHFIKNSESKDEVSGRAERVGMRSLKNEAEIVLPAKRKGPRCPDAVCPYLVDDTGAYIHRDGGSDSHMKKRNQGSPPRICRPFYGTTELEKSSLNAINHLLKAEKELRKVQFTAGTVIPQAEQYVEQVNTIHNDLKQFNTLFREVQHQTNEALEQKGARHFHFVIQASPTKMKTTSGPLPPR